MSFVWPLLSRPLLVLLDLAFLTSEGNLHVRIRKCQIFKSYLVPSTLYKCPLQHDENIFSTAFVPTDVLSQSHFAAASKEKPASLTRQAPPGSKVVFHVSKCPVFMSKIHLIFCKLHLKPTARRGGGCGGSST